MATDGIFDFEEAFNEDLNEANIISDQHALKIAMEPSQSYTTTLISGSDSQIINNKDSIIRNGNLSNDDINTPLNSNGTNGKTNNIHNKIIDNSDIRLDSKKSINGINNNNNSNENENDKNENKETDNLDHDKEEELDEEELYDRFVPRDPEEERRIQEQLKLLQIQELVRLQNIHNNNNKKNNGVIDNDHHDVADYILTQPNDESQIIRNADELLDEDNNESSYISLPLDLVTPPENFSFVCGKIYRSSFPRIENFKFLQKLKLKSIICLIPEDYPTENSKFNEENNINFFQIGLSGNKEPFVKIKPDLVTKALKIILNPENQPILIHCNRGKHRTGCISGCIRKLQSWSLSMIFDEYRKFAYPKERPLDQQFIEMYDDSILQEFLNNNNWLPIPW